MRIAYLNVHYRRDHTGGGPVHMEQFVSNTAALGHEVWSHADFGVSGARRLPTTRIARIRAMQRMDVLYVRVDSSFPHECSWTLPPRRALFGFPVAVWEFNTVPEHGLLRGRSEDNVRKSVASFRRFGRGCDLAACVSDALAGYVREKLGIHRTLTVPNGSDPSAFRPDVTVVPRLAPYKDRFNVVWVGSGKELWHDFETMGEAARMLCDTDSGRGIAFHIIGPDVAGVMANMPPNVYYWGAESYEKLPRWLSGMDIGLNLYRPGPADYNCPLKVPDYMASGLAVVSTEQPLVKSVLEQLGAPDLLVPHGDPACLARVLSDLASHRERVQNLGRAGRKLVIERYNWRRAVQETMNEIATVLKEKGKVPKA
jgi:glycosyltransferase involved in cell wall biosynthesis